jgi:hypothetical protein
MGAVLNSNNVYCFFVVYGLTEGARPYWVWEDAMCKRQNFDISAQ